MVLVSRLALPAPPRALLPRVAAAARFVVGRRAGAFVAAAGFRLGRVGFAGATAARVGGIVRSAFSSPRLLGLRRAPTIRRVVLVLLVVYAEAGQGVDDTPGTAHFCASSGAARPGLRMDESGRVEAETFHDGASRPRF